VSRRRWSWPSRWAVWEASAFAFVQQPTVMPPVPLNCIDGSAWVWSTKQAKDKVVFKLLLNDQVWAKGEDVVVEAGRKIEIVPVF
jgi:hypothetical protein